MNKSSNSYDVIIIGAGIGGLVCGCYLAKAGLKVLIAEQHYKPGGYCTSFKRKGLTFDAAAHSFGSYREGGNMKLIIKSLNIEKKLKIKRHTPSDIIISPDYKITFWPDINETIEELQNMFPDEAANINNFISNLINYRPVDFAILRKKTFKEFLDSYFQNNQLKAILSIPVLGNGALPPSLISAFTGSKIFREFILDGGYCPDEGMQVLPDNLAERFKELGGELQLSCYVKKIVVKNNKVSGIVIEKNNFIRAKYVVSNCDARQTFVNLLGKNVINKVHLSRIVKMIPSLSSFILYLGIDKPFNSLPQPGTNIWHLPHYDLEKIYHCATKGDFKGVGGYMVRLSPDQKTILSFVNAPYKNRKYWDTNKDSELENLIDRIERNTISNLTRHIVYKDAATPITLHRYTLNYKGAAYGWATTPSQLFSPELRQKTIIKGLYLCGHWTTQTQGIPGVAYIGFNTSKLILKSVKLK